MKLVANMWLRSGDTSSANNFLSFLEDTLSKLQDKRVSLTRDDSGFCSSDILSHLEEKPLNYIVAARFYEPVQRLLAGNMGWLRVDEGIEVSETTYQAPTWSKPRRLVMVRQRVTERPQAPGKTLRLFEDDEFCNGYRYSAYYTSLNLAPAEVWRLYRGRADAENRIKELKADFGFNSFNLKSFEGTEAPRTFAMLAYNLMSIFRQFIIQSKTQHTLSTLRYKTFDIGAYMEKVKDKVVLRISLNLKRLRWFDSLWQAVNTTCPPFKKSIA